CVFKLVLAADHGLQALRGLWVSEGGGGGRGLKEKHNGLDYSDDPIGICLEYELPSLSEGACTVFTHDAGLQDGNTGNGRATRQVHEVTNDGNLNEVGLEVRKEAPSSYANKLSPTPLTKAIL
ncbi:hypothetical protein Tco_1358202, partial [Tanacetum coccineum]